MQKSWASRKNKHGYLARISSHKMNARSSIKRKLVEFVVSTKVIVKCLAFSLAIWLRALDKKSYSGA